MRELAVAVCIMRFGYTHGETYGGTYGGTYGENSPKGAGCARRLSTPDLSEKRKSGETARESGKKRDR